VCLPKKLIYNSGGILTSKKPFDFDADSDYGPDPDIFNEISITSG